MMQGSSSFSGTLCPAITAFGLCPWLAGALLRAGHLPLWDPYLWSGTPLLAGWNAGALYPGTFLFAFLPAPVAWSVASLAGFLGTGWHSEHGIARGPMASVTDDLGRVAESDVHAMSVYLSSNMGGRDVAERHRHTEVAASKGGVGGDIFAASCASCHEGTEPLPFGGIDFALSSAVNAPEPRNIILVTLAGLPAADGRPAGMMPGFDGAISNEDLAALLGYLRARFSDHPAWSNLVTRIQVARRELQKNGQP